jgi:RHS repeat-associated protein
VVTLVTKTVGSGTNYALSTSVSYDTTHFSQSSFTATPSGPTLTGGTTPTTTLYNVNISSYAPNGDILAANDSVNGNWTYSYDPFNRLLGANKNSGAEVYSYDYDRFGNRWHQNGPHSSQLGFDASNRVTGVTGVGYDAGGNMISDGSGPGTHTYFYDAENRIIQVDGTLGTCATATACYVYDAAGQRVRKTTGSTSVDYLYDLAGHEITELSSAGAWNRGEVYAGGKHVNTYRSSTTYFNHADWLGTERARTSVFGSLYETCTSLPFGDSLSCSGSDPSPMHFTAKERDFESGLDNFGARYDSSSMGRFMSPDNLVGVEEEASPQSLNLYSYVQDNPTNAVDPDGHDCVFVDGSSVKVARGTCDGIKNGQYVAGTIDVHSGTYNSATGTVGFSYTPYAGGLGSGVISGVYPTSGVSDADRFSAVSQGMQIATPGVNLAANGLRTFGYVVAAPLMAIAECAAAGKDCSAGGTALALIPGGGDWEAINALRPLSAMGHAAKHLEEFKKINPALTEEAVAKILTYVKEAYPGVAQASGKVVHEGEVIVAGQKITVRVVVTSSGNIKTGFPVR